MEFLEEAPDDQIMALADFIDEGEVAHLVDDSDSASLAVGVTMMSKVPHTVLVDILSESVANLKGKKVLKNCKLKDPKILIKLRNLKYMVPGTFAMRGGGGGGGTFGVLMPCRTTIASDEPVFFLQASC